MNDLNSWIWIPLLVYCLWNCCNAKLRRNTADSELKKNLLIESDHKCKVLFNKDIDQLVVPKLTEADECTLSIPKNTRITASSITSTDLKADSSYSAPRRVSFVLKMAIVSCILWFLCLDIYDYYTELRIYQLRFAPLLFVFIGLAWDLQRSYCRRMIFFHSLWYMIGYLLMEDY